MKLIRLLAAVSAAVMPVAASAATYIIPAVGTGPGANGSQWKTEIKLHATGTQYVEARLRLHQGTAVHDESPKPGQPILRVAPSSTITLDDVVENRFFGITGTAALEVIVPSEQDFRRLAVTSRTYNALTNGDELGQDVPALKLEEAAIEGDLVIIPGPSQVARQRFNFGMYAVEPTRIAWDLLRADGRAVTSRTITYAAGQHIQYNNGVATLFGQTGQDSDSVRAVLESGKAILYGSSIDQSGDPTYIPGFRTREQFNLIFEGIDIDGDEKVEIADANGDGVLDRPLDIVTSPAPVTIHVIATTEFGGVIRSGLTLLSSTAEAHFGERSAALTIIASPEFKGKTGEIRIQARSDSSIEVFVIPVRFL
jgi:hypothetical protein